MMALLLNMSSWHPWAVSLGACAQAMAGGYCCINFDSLQLKDGWDGWDGSWQLGWLGWDARSLSRCAHVFSRELAGMHVFFLWRRFAGHFFWCCEELSIGDVIYFPCCNAPILVWCLSSSMLQTIQTNTTTSFGCSVYTRFHSTSPTVSSCMS